ncbi:MAG TPA: DUF6152 family protein [Vicinamibacterales bacterium]
MKRSLTMFAAATVIATMASDAYAHHSHPYFYDQCKTVTIEGRVEKAEWKDPHTLIVVRVDDESLYTIDWNGLSALTRDRVIGPAKEALVFGARVAVSGNPIRTAAQIREHFPEFTSDVNPRTLDPMSIRRVDNSFNWAQPRPVASPPDCNRK